MNQSSISIHSCFFNGINELLPCYLVLWASGCQDLNCLKWGIEFAWIWGLGLLIRQVASAFSISDFRFAGACACRKVPRILAQGGLRPPSKGPLGPFWLGAVFAGNWGNFRKFSKIVWRCRISCLIVLEHSRIPILTQFGSAVILLFSKLLISWNST